MISKQFRIRLLVGLIAVLAAISSCSDRVVNNSSSVDIDFKTPSSNKYDVERTFSKIACIQLETNDSCLIGKIKKVACIGDTVVILTDNRKVYSFSKTSGNFIGEIGHQGEGPEEYIEATNFAVTNDRHMVIIDRIRNQANFYTAAGRLIKSLRANFNLIGVNDVECCPDGNIIFANLLGTYSDGNNYCFEVSDGICQEVVKRFDLISPVSVKAGRYVAFANRHFAKVGDTVLFSKFANDTIFSYGKNGDIEGKYVIKMDKPIPTKKVISQLGAFDLSDYYSFCQKKGYAPSFNKIFASDSLICLVPLVPEHDGYYWYERKTGSTHKIDGRLYVEDEIDDVLKGKSIVNIVGSDSKEFISAFGGLDIKVLKKEMKRVKTINSLKSLKKIAYKADIEGNPILVFYEH